MAWRTRINEIATLSGLAVQIVEDSRGWPLRGTITDSGGTERSFSIHMAGDCHHRMVRGTQQADHEYRFQSGDVRAASPVSDSLGTPVFFSAFRETGEAEFILIVDAEYRLGDTGRFSIPFSDGMVEIARQEELALWRNSHDALFVLCRPEDVQDVLGQILEGDLLDTSIHVVDDIPVDLEPVQRISRQVRQTVRDASFGRRVKTAYQDTCIICGNNDSVLMIGAHINPVASPTSNDHETNGACLCSHCHILFDAHDIILHMDYTLEYSERIQNLQPTSSHYADYLDSLPDSLQFPEGSTIVPNQEMIVLRYEFYEISL